MFYLLFSLIALVLILFIIANIQVSSFSKKYENFTVPNIGTIRDRIIKLPFYNNRKISSIIQNNIKDKKKEIEDVQILDDTEKIAYSITD
jgi:hypothetical protein